MATRDEYRPTAGGPTPAPRGDVEVALDEQREAHARLLGTADDGAQLIVRHKDLVLERHHALNPVLPDHVQQQERMVEPASFIAYLQAFASPTAIVRAHAPVLESPALAKLRATKGELPPMPWFEAVLDYHGRAREAGDAAVPGRCTHLVRLDCPFSADYLKWRDVLMGGYLDQRQMIEHCENLIHTIAAPPAGDLFDALGAVALERVTKFRSARNDRNGTVAILFDEQDGDHSTTGSAALPDHVELVLPIYQGGAVMRLTAKLRYRLDGPKLFLGFHVASMDKLEREAFAAIGQSVATATARPVYYVA